jgi:hypothetical protein
MTNFRMALLELGKFELGRRSDLSSRRAAAAARKRCGVWLKPAEVERARIGPTTNARPRTGTRGENRELRRGNEILKTAESSFVRELDPRGCR